MVGSIVKRFALTLFGDYQLYWVFRYELGAAAATLERDPDVRALSAAEILDLPPELRARAFYEGRGAHAVGMWSDGELAAVTWAWDHARYRDSIWPIKSGEAFVMDLFTLPKFRGRGLGSRLMTAVAKFLADLGYQRAFCAVWWSHRTSIFMTERGGWRKEAFVLQLYPLRSKRALRLYWRVRARS